MKQYLFFLFAFSLLVNSYSQQEVPFDINKQFYIKGGSTIIGNNAVSKHSTKPFNDLGMINDQIKMKYVDVDDDASTFSSSQAYLQLPNKDSKIVYAGLYWSAIYSFNKGVKKRKGNNFVYIGNNERDSIFNTIKIKTPNKNYISVKGEILFDGFKTKKYKNNSPYVCYSDVTNLFNNNQVENGLITVANIKATQGFISGGSASGWFIYIVYEDQQDDFKSITTYDGFSQVNKKSEAITFENFKTNNLGIAKANVSVAVLEGDAALRTDECIIINNDTKKQIGLESNFRFRHNFFNSTINNKSNTLKRIPASKNTLGFDVLQQNIPNENNETITNNIDNITFQFNTRSDRFFLFFTAFETTIDKSYLEEKIAVTTSTLNEIALNTKDEVIIIEEVIETKNTASNIISEANNEEIIQAIEHPKPVFIPKQVEKTLKDINLDKGYYLVTNAFSKPNLTKKWMQFLESKGYSPKLFMNPNNNLEYVYVYSSENRDEVKQESLLLEQKPYFEDLWVFVID